MFLFNLFKKKPKVIIKISRGYKIYMTEEVAKSLEKKHYYISLCLSNGKPSCVQLMHNCKGGSKYVMTLKKFLGVKGFKNGNVCDFLPKNLEY